MTLVQANIWELAEQFNSGDWRTEDLIRIAVDELHPALALACSFSAEDLVLIDLLLAQRPDVRVFAMDTGRLPEETYHIAQVLRDRYDLHVEWYAPSANAVEELLRTKGAYSFYENLNNRHECCRIRKVEPLRRALKGLEGWITGQRRGQSVTRSNLKIAEIDGLHGCILKLNPLAHWSREDVWDYIHRHDLPVNQLYRQGYQSIGCAPCTRAVKPGEDERAGRWWWEDAERKECGLHQQRR